MLESWQFAGRTRPLNRRPGEAGKAEPHRLHHASGVGALVRQRRRESVLRGAALRLDARLPRRRRSLLWGRQSARWNDLDFEANARDGVAVDWPIRYADIAPWCDYVERFAGISGSRDRLPQLPDGQFLPPMEMNCLEQQVKERIAKSFGGRAMIIGRAANLTQPHNGRGGCQCRSRCIRGCPYEAPTSAATPRRCRPPMRSGLTPAVLDRDRGHLRPQDPPGLRRAHRRCRDEPDIEVNSPGSSSSARPAVASTFILLNSVSDRFPNGLGNDSGSSATT